MTPPRIPDSYEEALKFHATFTDASKAMSLERFETVAEDIADFRAALRKLGDPHLQYTVAHIAGSKGKGSTSSFIARILRQSGRKTGLFTSPHLVDATEKASVNGTDISREEYGRLIALLRTVMPDGLDKPEPSAAKRILQTLRLMKPPVQIRRARNTQGYFTGVSLIHFANEKVDAAVIEVCSGGRLDHTNVFDQPPSQPGGALVTAITAMALEHKRILGDNILAISRHKAGIIRPHGLAVLGPQKPEWYDDVARAVEERRSQVSAPPVLDVRHAITYDPATVAISAAGTSATFRADRAILEKWLADVGTSSSTSTNALLDALDSGLQLSSPLPGIHQMDNLRTVLGAVVAFNARGVAIPVDAVAEAIPATRWPARFEIISHDPLVVVDCCHEPLSIETFSRTFREIYGDRPIIGVTAFLRDNDIPAMCRATIPHLNFSEIICCTPEMLIRSRKASSSVKYMRQVLDVPISTISAPRDAIRHAMRVRTGNQAVVVFGDFYIAGTARTLLPTLLAGQENT